MKIGLDVMGGDFAPKATIDGALLAVGELTDGDSLVLFGDEGIIRTELEKQGVDQALFQIVNAPDVIGMDEHPTRALAQKHNSSIVVGFEHLKHGEIQAFASAGSSGAMLVGAIYSVNTIQGVIRPCTGSLIPQQAGGVSFLLDVGTNPDPKPDVLYQFGLLGSILMKDVYGIPSPRVGLLNIGHEPQKGNLLTQAAFQLMDQSKDFNFIGNIEGRDILRNKADVIVCDGFTGNVLLKSIESIYRIMVKHNTLDDYFARFNYENYGGTPILGINSTVIVGHGISNDLAIKNMILQARDVHNANITDEIRHVITGDLVQ